MSDQDVIAEAKAIVDDLINPETLSVLDWIENVGTILPTKTLTFYLDLAAGVALADAVDERNAEEIRIARQKIMDGPKSIADPEPDMTRLVELDKKIEELRAKATKSGLVFHLQGVSPRSQGEIEATIMKSDLSDDDKGEALMYQITAKNLVRVKVEANGQEITTFNAAVAERLIKSLPQPDQKRLFEAVRVLNTAAVLADPRVDAGFPGEHPGAAEEPVSANGAEGSPGVGD